MWKLTVLGAALAVALPARAQEPIVVSLSVSEQTGGLFQSGFAAALRALGDVRVVEPMGSADFRLAVSVVCDQPDCRDARRYAVAIHLSAPVDSLAVREILAGAPPAMEPQVAVMARLAHGAAHNKLMQVAILGRSVYEQSVRELVALLDAQCFEQRRILYRTSRTTEPTQFERLLAQHEQLIRTHGLYCG